MSLLSTGPALGVGPRHDRWIGSVDVRAGANVIRWREGASTRSVTIPAGRYWLYFAPTSGTEIAGCPSLYRQLLTLINAGSPNVYALSYADPPGEVSGLHRGLRIVRTSGSTAFGYDAGAGSFTFAPREALGLPPTSAGPLLTLSAELVSPRGIRGQWVSPRRAAMKVSHLARRVESSTEEVERDDAYQISWASRRLRAWRYTQLPAGLIHRGRALDSEYYLPANLLPGDDSYAFDWMWDELSALRDIIVVHERGAESASIQLRNADAAHYWNSVEVLRAFDGAQRADYSSLTEITTQAGEVYSLTLATVYRRGGYQQ